MSLDRNKVLEAAQKYMAKGQYDKAIIEYQKILAADPKDVRTLLKIGDLQTRKGANKEACDTYLQVAESYSSQGFHSKSVAVYKQVVKLDPSRLDAYMRLASNYEELQLLSDAMATYEQVAQAYLSVGDLENAQKTLLKMTQLDPQNLPVRIRYAEALSKSNRTKEAAEEFAFGANLLKQQGRMDDYLKVAERLLFHRPEDVALARELAQLYLQRSDGKRALAKLQVCFKANPKDTGVLDLLAQAFLKLEQAPKAISVYREVAKLHLEAKRPEERARVLKRILELDPNDAEARQALAAYAQPEKPKLGAENILPASAVVGASAREPSNSAAKPMPGSSPRPPTAPPPRSIPLPGQSVSAPLPRPEPSVAGAPPAPPRSPLSPKPAPEPEPELEAELLEDEDEDVIIVDEGTSDEVFIDDEGDAIDAPAPSRASVPPRSSIAASAPGPVASEPARSSIPDDVALEAQVARLLTECDVFARYGLKTKILEQLERAVSIAPSHVGARERLRDVYLEQGRTDDAVEQMVTLARIVADDKPDHAQRYLRQALLLDPENLDARAALRASMPPPGVAGPTPVPTSKPGSLAPTHEPPPPGEEDAVLFVDDAPETAEIALDEAPAHEVATRAFAPPANTDHATSEPPVFLADGEPAAATATREEVTSIGEIPSAPPTRAMTSVPAPEREETTASFAALAEAEPAAAATEPPPYAPAGPTPVPEAYEAPPAEFHDEEPLHEAPWPVAEPFVEPQVHTEPEPVYAAPEPAYAEPQVHLEPEPVYAAPEPVYAAPEPVYAAPEPAYAEPAPEAPATTPPAPRDEVSGLAPISPEEFDAAPASVSEAPQRVSFAPGEVEEILEEADFYMAQALWEEARDTIDDALESHPNHPILLDKLQEIEEAAAAAPSMLPPPAPAVDHSFALAEKLAEELGEPGPADNAGDVLDVENVFAQFKRGIEQQIDASDSDTHYDLGIAYKEMGLLDDAVHEFELAMQNPERECIAATMIGLCMLEAGKPARAIDFFKRGLHAPRRGDREELGLFFELGAAYAVLGDKTEALYYFKRVQAKDPTFRSVEARMRALGPIAPPPKAAPATPIDDVDRAFDDLLGDD